MTLPVWDKQRVFSEPMMERGALGGRVQPEDIDVVFLFGF